MLSGHDLVRDVAVFGIPSQSSASIEQILAVIFPSQDGLNDQQKTKAKLLEFVGQKIDFGNISFNIRFVSNEIPRNRHGKVSFQQFVELYLK